MEFDGEDGIACHGLEDERSVDGIAKGKIASETKKDDYRIVNHKLYADKLSEVLMSGNS